MTVLHVRIRAAGEDYALSVEDVIEVAELGHITPVPGAPSAVLGVRNLRGTVLPVVDLATVLGLPQAGPSERIVVAEQAGRRAALAVESVTGVEQLPSASEEVESPHLVGAALADGALVGILDVGSVLNSVQGAPVR
jgi:purine-binding chemotaxis protein CheW